jgi:hypothetical protein
VRDSTVHPVAAADVVILLAVLGRYAGEMGVGLVADDRVEALGRRCVKVGLLPPGSESSRAAVVSVLEDIGQRLRFAIGEYDADPTR